MRIILCDGCNRVLQAQHEFANVNALEKRLDLCYETCYQHYEALLREEEKLANMTAGEIAQRRLALFEEFKAKIQAEKHGRA